MVYREITSTKNPHIKELGQLKEKKYRDEQQLALIEGWNMVHEAGGLNLLVEVLVSNDDLGRLAQYENIIITVCPKNVIAKLSQSMNNQNVIGVLDLKKIKQNDILNSEQNILVLENIQDPGNLGTLIRSALGFDFSNIILVNNSVDLFNAKVLRSTQGALFHLQIQILNGDYVSQIENLAVSKNYEIITTSLYESSTDLQEIKLNNKYKKMLILGNEGNGISLELNRLSHKNIKIRISPKLESLNVAQAGAIIMYQINQQEERTNV